MSNKVDAIKGIGSEYRSETIKNDIEKKKINCCFGDKTAYIPPCGIGNLLNGSQPSQTAVQA